MSGHEAAARLRKAIALVETCRLVGMTSDLARKATAWQRELIVQIAIETGDVEWTDPSETTWQIVVDILLDGEHRAAAIAGAA